MTGGSVTGTFDNVVGGRVNYDYGSFGVLISPTFVRLQEFEAVPEPGSAVLCAAGGLLLIARRHRTQRS